MQNARRHLLSTRLELNAGEIDQRLAAVQLYKALRSWKRTETQFPYEASDSPTPSDFCQPHPLLTDTSGKSWISMEDYAIAFVDEIEAPMHVRQRFTVGY